MCLPLTAEGEFVLVSEHLEAIRSKPALMRGFSVDDNALNFMLADLAVLQRDDASLRMYASLASESAQQNGHKLYQASAQRALGVLHRLTGDHEEAESNLHRALQLFEFLEARWQIGRTLAELGELARARNDYVQCRDYYCRSIDLFEEIGAIPDRLRTQRALDSLDR